MKLERTDYGALAVLAPRGELTGEDVETFRREVHRCLDAGSADLILDCSAIGAYDSAALELLLELRRLCRDRGGKLKLCRPDAIGRKIFEITRLEQQFELFDDVEAAIRSYS